MSQDAIPESDRFNAKESKEFGAASIDQEAIDQQNTEGKGEPLEGSEEQEVDN